MRLDRALYYTADKSGFVEEGDPAAAFVLGGVGTEIPDDEARRIGLMPAVDENKSTNPKLPPLRSARAEDLTDDEARALANKLYPYLMQISEGEASVANESKSVDHVDGGKGTSPAKPEAGKTETGNPVTLTPEEQAQADAKAKADANAKNLRDPNFDGNDLSIIDGLNEGVIEKLRKAKIDTIKKIRNASDDDLLAIDGIGDRTLESIREQMKAADGS